MKNLTHFAITIHDSYFPFKSIDGVIDFLKEHIQPSSFFKDSQNKISRYYEGETYDSPLFFSDLVEEVELSHEQIKDIVDKIEITIKNSTATLKNRHPFSGELLYYSKQRAEYVINTINYYRYQWKKPEDIKF